MNILLTIHDYHPPFVIGGPRYFKEFAERLLKRGHSIRVFSSHNNRRKTCHQNINGIDVLNFPTLPPIVLKEKRTSTSSHTSTFNPIINSFPLRGLIAFPQNAHMMLPYLAFHMDEFDILHAGASIHSCPYVCYLANLFAPFLSKKRKPIVLTPFLHTERTSHTRPHIFELFKRIDGILVETNYEKRFLISKGIDEKRIFKAGIGVEPQAYAVDGNIKKLIEELRNWLEISDNMCLWIGGRFYYKGFYHLILAMKEVWKFLKNAKLIIIGPKASLEAASIPPQIISNVNTILKRNIGKRIIDLGVVEDDVKKALLHMTDIVVQPSLTETISFTLLEAWTCKKPVVVANIPTLYPTIKGNGDGVELCNFGDVPNIASSIIHLFNHKEYRQNLGMKGYNKVISYYKWDDVVTRIESAYETILSRRRFN